MRKNQSIEKKYLNIQTEIAECDLLLEKNPQEHILESTLIKREDLLDILHELAEQISNK